MIAFPAGNPMIRAKSLRITSLLSNYKALNLISTRKYSFSPALNIEFTKDPDTEINNESNSKSNNELDCEKNNGKKFSGKRKYYLGVQLPKGSMRFRNIGIIAHIDAGKTTCTERMLYFSGVIPCMGNVDDGSTTTDFLPVERARGITINSATVHFPWRKNTICLIDTPGHADFTFEVERSVRVLDGAVCILDASKGVEAQTEKVWLQADKYRIPRIVFLNKMDHVAASFGQSMQEVQRTFGVRPLALQIPWVEENKDGTYKFTGVIDLINRSKIEWTSEDGKQISVTSVDNLSLPIQKEVDSGFNHIADTLAEKDEEFFNLFVNAESPLDISTEDYMAALRRCTLRRKIVPVLCGSSLKNIGIQPLLDAILDFLPSPVGLPIPLISDSNDLHATSQLQMSDPGPCALAFKVQHDAKEGQMIFAKCYRGIITPKMALYNTGLHTVEYVSKILKPQGDKLVELKHLRAGEIGILLGTSKTRTGDTLFDSIEGKRHKNRHLLPIAIPPPVFVASINPISVSDEKSLVKGLELLVQEDPSLAYYQDADSGQLLLSGMGELHLEIAFNRLRDHFKVKAELGDVRIRLREGLKNETSLIEYSLEHDQKNIGMTAEARLSPIPQEIDDLIASKSVPSISMLCDSISEEALNSPIVEVEKNYLKIPRETVDFVAKTINETPEKVFQTIIQGLCAGLLIGKLQYLPLIDVYAEFEVKECKKSNTLADLLTLARKTIRTIIDQTSKTSFCIMEPLMDVSIYTKNSYVGAISQDLVGHRDAEIVHIEEISEDDAAVEEMMHLTDQQPAKIYLPPDNIQTMREVDDLTDEGTHVHAPAVDEWKFKQNKASIHAYVPLKKMIGYNSILQMVTKGHGTFTQTVYKYRPMRHSA